MSIRKPGYLIWLLCLFSCRHAKPVDNTMPAWFKNEFIYNLDVKTFKDSDGDGTGDFRGLTGKLDYLQTLGVTTIWLAPFQPSPQKDDGYDVTDFYAIDPQLGSKADFQNFMEDAHRRQMHVIMDMVLNHSSIAHPWFRDAARDTTTEKHNWYVWSAKRPSDWNKGTGFPGVEEATWTLDTTARQYYFHRFYAFEPDLNFQNEAVMQESQRILAHWLDLGIDGFRLDAVPFMIDDPRESAEDPKHDFEVLHRLARFVKSKKPAAILLGEANVAPAENKQYFSRAGDGLDLMFNFYANQFLFYALASGHTKGLHDALIKTSEKPGQDQWAYFLRNHDEVDLGRLGKKQLQEVYDSLGPDPTMQLYGRGIRRRLAPMLGNNLQRLKQAYCLLMTLPGTPIIRYGEETGMGDDLQLKERLAIRTPMQWDNSKNSGFSAADSTIRPVISSGSFGYDNVNVASALADSTSLLNFIRKMARLRKRFPMIGAGYWQVVETGSDKALALLLSNGHDRLLACFNFNNSTEQLHPDIGNANLINLLSDQPDNKLTLEPYGYRWYLLK